MNFYRLAVGDVLGLTPPEIDSTDRKLSENLIRILLQMRIEARQKNDFEMADKIRNDLAALGIEVKDTREGFEWKLTS
jgi:cysteinyl-tRNA synthetase